MTTDHTPDTKRDELLRLIRREATPEDIRNRKSWVYGIMHALEIFGYPTEE